MKFDSKKMVLIITSTLAILTSCKKPESKSIFTPKPPQEFRIALQEDITSFDPREANSATTVNISQLLFEGLARYDQNNVAQPTLAEKIDISEDAKTYTFYLKKSFWSDGKEVTADDFEYTWKSTLNPDNEIKNSFQLFCLENAKLFHEGKAPEETVGVRALDDNTLEVKLQEPNPNFIELLTLPAFFPIDREWEEDHLDWKEDDKPSCLGNGPFYLESVNSEIVLKKNLKYWDTNRVTFKEVHLEKLEEDDAIEKFKNQKLDWVGSPTMAFSFSSIDKLKSEKLLETVDAAASQFIRVNTTVFPFSNESIRNAFSYAIDRDGISDKFLHGTKVGTFSLIPPPLCHESDDSLMYLYNQEKAHEFFLQGCETLKITHDKMPEITLSYAVNNHASIVAHAIQQNWKDTLAIEVKLEELTKQELYKKLKMGNYQLALSSWFAEYMDPLTFLNLFKKKNGGMNFTGWENKDYKKLISKIKTAKTPSEKIELVKKAQAILLEAAPIFPLFYYTFNYLKANDVKMVNVSPIGILSINEGKIT